MNISDSFHNSFYALTGNNIEDEIITNTRLISLTMLVSLEELSLASSLAKNKERYLQLNQVLYEHQAKRR